MAQTIKLKRSATTGNAPTTSQLALGELGINTTDGKLFLKKSVSGTESIVEVGGLPLSGGSLTGNLNLGDNVKAQFGASNDLEIYHDGSGSYIDDVGTGNLFVRADSLQLRRADGSQLYLAANTGAEVALYHAGNAKLATTSTGIDVTGSVVADGLTVDGNASVAGTTGVVLDTGTITTGKDSASSRTHWQMNNPNGQVAKWDSNGTDLLHYITDEYKLYTGGNKAFEIDGNGDISFYEDTGTTPKFFWDASLERLGLRTSTPIDTLDIRSGGLRLYDNTDGNGGVISFGSSSGYQTIGGGSGSNDMHFRTYANHIFKTTTGASSTTDGTERLKINSTGIDVTGSVTADKVTIGTSVVNYSGTDLTVGDNSDSQNGIAIQTSTTGNGYILFGDGSGASAYNSQIRFDHSTNKMHLRVAGSETLVASTGGIDVTGSVVADGLTVDGGTATPIINLSRSGTYSGITFSQTVTNVTGAGADLSTYSLNANTGYVWQTCDSGGTTAKALYIAPNKDISFYNDSAAQGLFWDSSTSQLRVGSTSAIFTNSVIQGVSALGPTIGAKQTTANQFAGGFWNNNSGDVSLIAFYAGFGGSQIGSIKGNSTSVQLLGSSGSGLSISSTGNVNIPNGGLMVGSTTAPTANLHVKNTSSNAVIKVETADGLDSRLILDAPAISGAQSQIFFDASGTTAGSIQYTHNSGGTNFMTFHTGGSNVERMRLNSDGSCRWTPDGTTHDMTLTADGNLLVGRTSASGVDTDGHVLFGNGVSYQSNTDNAAQFVNRNGTDDGSITSFYKNGTNVGSIGAKGGTAYLIGSNKGLRVSGSGLIPITTGGANSDATYDLGDPSVRFKDLYLSGSAFIDNQTRLGNGSASSPAYSFSADSDSGMFRATTNQLGFATGGQEAARIDASQNLLVGTSSTSPWTAGTNSSADSGIALRSDGIFAASAYKASANSGNVALFNRTGTDGPVCSFLRNGTTVGSIGSDNSGSDLVIDATRYTNRAGLRFRNSALFPRQNSADADAVVDLGSSGARFKDLYLSNNATAQKLTLTKDPVGTYSIEVDGTNTGQPNLIVKQSTSERFRCDNNGNLLVGTSNTTWQSQEGLRYFNGNSLIVTRDSDEPMSLNRLTNDGDLLIFRKDGTTVGSIGTQGGDLNIGTGACGIQFVDGVPALYPWTTTGNTTRDAAIDLGDSGARFKDLYLSGNLRANTGNAYFGAHISPHGDNAYVNMLGSNRIQFLTNGTEAARIDASQNLLVGQSSAYTGSGVTISPLGVVQSERNNVSGVFIRTGSDGDILQFRRDSGVTVGSIQSRAGVVTTVVLNPASGNGAGLSGGTKCIVPADEAGIIDNDISLGISTHRFKDLYLAGSVNIGDAKTVGHGAISLKYDLVYMTAGVISPSNSDGTDNDNSVDLGKSAARFDDIYATNGTIQTSDRNEKQDIEDLTEAEERVAVAAKGLLKKFRWKSAVEDKGDDARIHFGIIAQDLQAAFEAEGLDAGRYGMFTSNTWTNEDGEEQTRMGVRYSELLAFIISAI